MSWVTKYVPIRPLLCTQNARLFYLYFTIKIILKKFSSENFKITPPPRYSYFDVLMKLAWSSDSGSYVGSCRATGRLSLARQVTGGSPDKKG